MKKYQEVRQSKRHSKQQQTIKTFLPAKVSGFRQVALLPVDIQFPTTESPKGVVVHCTWNANGDGGRNEARRRGNMPRLS